MNYFRESRRLVRFDSVIGRAQSLCFEDVFFEPGAAKDNGGEGVKRRVALEPCEHVEAVHPRHLQVHHEQSWEGIGLAVSVRPAPSR